MIRLIAVLKRLWKHGIGTIPKDELLHVNGRGKLLLDDTKCTACGDCVLECPSEALSLRRVQNEFDFSITYSSCISCRVCTEVCPTNAFSYANEPMPSVQLRDELVVHYTINRDESEPKGEIVSDRDRREVILKN
ncbi:4Fe-4S binding protein [Alicyclobacillus tolerans]|uniref:4Fe-4S binding protein n=1 Tax=Alicyclobacillus TaxID=29330 RepID=UPI0009FAD763|nr:4Fe-4S dicluster domain-containing protein [Alicyclobacillus sp. TC]